MDTQHPANVVLNNFGTTKRDDIHRLNAEVDGQEVARVTRRGPGNPQPTPGYWAWITSGINRGLIRNKQGGVVYFDTPEEAVIALRWLV